MRNPFMRKERTPDGGMITISYSILGIGLIILILAITAIAMIDRANSWNIELRDYISISTFGCVTIGLIYNASSLQYNYLLNKQKHEKELVENKGKKIKITYEAVSEWYKVDMGMNAEIARKFLQPYKGKLGKSKVLSEFKEELNKKENAQIRKSLTCVLNYFEHLSLLCVDNVIDEDILKKTFRTAFTTYYTNLKEYIEDEQKGNSGANSKIFINFVDISKKWLYN